VEWKSTFSELAGRNKLELVADLMPLNVGLLYRELEDVDRLGPAGRMDGAGHFLLTSSR